MLMTHLGREIPHLDPGVMFSELELRFLADYARKFGLAPPDDLGTAVKLVAILGGYLDRKHDPPPGDRKMWEGYPRLAIAAMAYECMLDALAVDEA